MRAYDLSRHIALYGTNYGFSITGSSLNYVASSGAAHNWYAGATNVMNLSSAGNLTLSGTLGVDSGGTGANNATTARANLGANNASNLTTGTLPNARISGAYDGITTLGMSGLLTVNTGGEAIRIASPNATSDPYVSFYKEATRQGYFQHTDGTGTAGLNIVNEVPAATTRIVLLNTGGANGLTYNDGASLRTVYHSGNLSLSTLSGTPDTRQIVAGNGLTGGGTLEANRTLTLGTPSPITNSSGDTVTSTSHSHSLGFIAAEVNTTTSANTTSFPLGHLLVVLVPSGMNRNASVVPCLHSSNAQYYVSQDHGSAGTVIPGTWRSRGRTDSEEGIYTLQRVG